MFLWPVIEGGVAILVGWFVMSQMVLPALRDTPSFPLFRKSVKSKEGAREKIRNLQELKEAKQLTKQAEALEKELQEHKPRKRRL